MGALAHQALVAVDGAARAPRKARAVPQDAADEMIAELGEAEAAAVLRGRQAKRLRPDRVAERHVEMRGRYRCDRRGRHQWSR